MQGIRWNLVLLLAPLAVAGVAQLPASVTSDACPGKLGDYQGRIIRKIQVTSPFSFLPAAKSVLNGAIEALPFRVGDPFDAHAFSEGASSITGYTQPKFPAGLTAVRIVVTMGTIEACSGGALEIHYRVVTALIPRTSGNLFELAKAMIEKPATSGGLLGSDGRLQLIPNLSYDATRRAFGGLMLDKAIALGPFNRIVIDASVSPNSFVGGLNLKGEANPGREYLNRTDWQLGLQTYNVLAGKFALKKAVLGTGIFGSTKELGSSTTLRYGSYVAGGHVQDNSQDSPNSPYGEVKLLGGVESRFGQTMIAASYGFQVGNSFSNNLNIFEKHIVDLRYSSTFAPFPKYIRNDHEGPDDRKDFIGKDHRPLSVEIQFNAGILSRATHLPSVERFLGGNQPSAPFIEGQTWDVRAEPYIRSVAENRVGLNAGQGIIGGSQFTSANITIGKGAFGKSLLPKELADQKFIEALDGASNSAQGLLSDTYYGRDIKVVAASAAVSGVGAELEKLKVELASLPSKLTTDQKVKPIVQALNSDLGKARRMVTAIAGGQGSYVPIFMNSLVPAVENDLIRLAMTTTSTGDGADAAALQVRKDSLNLAKTTLRLNWEALDTGAVRAKADAHAVKDFAPAESVLNTLLYRLNAYSVAPVGTFDVARVLPDPGGTRFAGGGGIRLSIVNSNLTCGYSFNLARGHDDGVGAFFVKLDFTDLFR